MTSSEGKFLLRKLIEREKVKIRFLITTLLIIFLSSFLTGCRSARFKVHPLCSISFKFQEITCRCYDLNIMSTVNPKKCGLDLDDGQTAWIIPWEEMEGLAGFYLDAWSTDIIPTAKYLIKRKGRH